jgi:hypothetical protein
VARELAPLLAHPRFQRYNQRPALSLAHGEPPLGRQATDRALDVEQRVDALHRLQGHRRHDRRCTAFGLAARCGFDVGELEELASRVGPA